MYPSSNNNASFFGNYYNDNNHSKTPQDLYNSPSFSPFQLPSPIYSPLDEEAVFYEFFRQQFVSNDHYHHNMINIELEMPNMESKMEEYRNNKKLVSMNDGDDDHCDFSTDHVLPENSSSLRKRHSKGDRHSKINTARGPRDRRMRLSLDVAKKLFGLQDLLGFDKASKTVDWLLTKSKTAILELIPDQSGSLMDVSNSASSTSDCEVMSGTADGFMVMTGDDDQATNKSKSSCGSSRKKKEKVVRVRKCADFHHPLAKASREKARERARKRTIEKRNNNHGSVLDSKSRPYCVDQATDQYAKQLASWGTLQENQHQTTDSWALSQGFNYQQEHQFNELQIN